MTPDELGDSPILVDTDVFSWAVWDREPAAWYRPFLDDRIWVLSFATVAELRHGALKAEWGAARQSTLEQRIRLCVVQPGTDAVATKWAELSRRFHRQIGMNDFWIAACSLVQDPTLPIASHDDAFSRIGAEFGIPIVRLDES